MNRVLYKGGVVPQHESETVIQDGLPSGEYEFAWSGTSDTDQFRTIKRTIIFDNKLATPPTDIRVSNTVLTNCSAFKVKKITDKGFTIVMTMIRAAENKVEFEWEAVA